MGEAPLKDGAPLYNAAASQHPGPYAGPSGAAVTVGPGVQGYLAHKKHPHP